jgi:uncharacterized membrane protein YjgN (DUF898 family)
MTEQALPEALADQPAVAQEASLEFRGKAGEYFGIWIVNLLLTLLTVGLYSPWAKVRTLRYFYNNTLLANSAFDYTGQPWAIFRGRMVAFGVFVLYGILVHFIPILDLPLILALFLATPWLVVRALLFNRHNTVYRNLRFGFTPDYKGAGWTYLGAPILGFLTAGLLMPYAAYRALKFKIEKSVYGRSQFGFNVSFGQYYLALFKGGMLGTLLMIPVLAVFLFLAYYLRAGEALSSITQTLDSGESAGPNRAATGLIIVAGYVGLFFFGYIYYHIVNAYVTNVTFSSTHLADLRLRSTLNPWMVTWIALSNALAILFSLGLLYPWAKIRMTRYRMSRLAIIAPTGFDQFVAGQGRAGTATGEELAGLFDVDIAL